MPTHPPRALDYIDTKHRNTLAALRSKLNKESLLECFQMASLVSSLMANLVETGVDPKPLKEKFLSGQRALELELQVALSEKTGSFKPTSITIVANLLKEHEVKSEEAFPSQSAKRLTAAGNLQREEFDLVLQMLQHDIRSYEQWVLRCEDRESARYHADLQFRRERQLEATRIAKCYLDASQKEWTLALFELDTPSNTVCKVREIINKVAKRLVRIRCQ